MPAAHHRLSPEWASLRPLGAGWTALLAGAGAATVWFGTASGRALEFGPVAWGLVCAAPAVLGALLALTSTADRQQYLARGLAAALMLPIGLAMWAGTADGPAASASAERATGPAIWALGLGLLLAWLLGWLALLAWAAQRATRIQPAPGTPALDAGRLHRRLAALQRSGAPLALAPIEQGTSGAPRVLEATLQVDPTGARGHRVRLQLDAARHAVFVVERLGAQAAAPLAGEGSFHRPGDPLVDASRPAVQRVSGRVRQTTMLDAAALAAWPLHWQGDELKAAVSCPGDWPGADAEGRGRMGAALLAAVVLGCGWTWRPQLWSRKLSSS